MSIFSQFGGIFGAAKALPRTTPVNPMSVADAVIKPAEAGAIYAAPAPEAVGGLSTGMPNPDFRTTMEKVGGLLGGANTAVNGSPEEGGGLPQWQSDAPPPPRVEHLDLKFAAPIANAPRRADLFRLGGLLPRITY